MSNAPNTEAESRRFRVTHPFHPLFGHEYDLIEYRHCWSEDRVFYIDETEIESRMFFEGLVAAYMSRVGSKTAGDEGPQLILPVGGG